MGQSAFLDLQSKDHPKEVENMAQLVSDTVSLAEIEITAQLSQRPARAPNYAAENRALVHLAHEMATNPSNILQKLVETALVLCRAGSAGISLLESHNGEAVFRWEALAGAYAMHRHTIMPRDASPCGTTIDRNATQLMVTPARVFFALQADPPVAEALLLPFRVEGRPIGTVWVIAHDDERTFDQEDARIMETLAQFAAAAWQVWQAQSDLERRVAERTAAWHHEMAERQRLEREARRAQHFALLGRLAAGVSHEIRNPLGAIFLHVDLLEEELRHPSPESAEEITQALTEIKGQLARLQDLVQDYLSLARVGTIELKAQDLGGAVQSWAQEWQQLATAQGVRLQLDGLTSLGQAMFHESTLRRAVLNLVQNALNAMPEGGTLTLEGVRTATHVQLHVRDTGIGMTAEQIPQIFEPLYTTKPEGTGLGLFIAHEIVAAHGGQVTVESSVWQGTTFTLQLPHEQCLGA
jgi:signal transduction histidine kinase